MRSWCVVTLLSLGSVLCACPGAPASPSPGDSGTPPAESGLPSEYRAPGSTLERPPAGGGLPEHLKPPR